MSQITLTYTISAETQSDVISGWRAKAGNALILGVALGVSDTSIVFSTPQTIAQGTCIVVDKEVVQVTATATGTTFTINRNTYGTGQVTHLINAIVRILVYPDPFTFFTTEYILPAHKQLSNGLGASSALYSSTSVTGQFA
jgi:hypothetical protein